jgi:hypothetical protein
MSSKRQLPLCRMLSMTHVAGFVHIVSTHNVCCLLIARYIGFMQENHLKYVCGDGGREAIRLHYA